VVHRVSNKRRVQNFQGKYFIDCNSLSLMAEKEFNKTLDVLLDQIEDIKEKIILKNSVIFVFAQIKKKEDKGSPSKFTKEVEESQDGFEFTKLKSEYFYEARLFHYKDQKTDKTPLITFYHCKLQIKKDLSGNKILYFFFFVCETVMTPQ
jgi:hypothetical protein